MLTRTSSTTDWCSSSPTLTLNAPVTKSRPFSSSNLLHPENSPPLQILRCANFQSQCVQKFSCELTIVAIFIFSLILKQKRTLKSKTVNLKRCCCCLPFSVLGLNRAKPVVTTATMTGEVILPEDFDPLQMLENFETFAKFALTETKMLPPPKQVPQSFSVL